MQVRVLSARLYTVINYVCQLVGGWVSWWVGWFVKGMFNQAVGWLVGQLVGTLVRRTNAWSVSLLEEYDDDDLQRFEVITSREMFFMT